MTPFLHLFRSLLKSSLFLTRPTQLLLFQCPNAIQNSSGIISKAFSSMHNFKAVSKLGEGAFGVVYKVVRKEDNRLYALKQIKLAKLNAKEKHHALNQVRILASLSHPNIVSYKESFFTQSNNSLNIVMQYAPGGDLSKLIDKHKTSGTRIPEQEIWKMLVNVCRGLRFLHSKSILHRDLKCANIFVRDDCYLIGDLNISKVAKDGMADTQVGTPFYASPEIWQESVYDDKSDMWSLGCMVYEMAALQPPFTAQDMVTLGKKIKTGSYSKISQTYSKDLSQVIDRLLKVNSVLRLNSEELLEHPLVKRNGPVLPMEPYEFPSPLLETIDFNEYNQKEMISKLPLANYDFPVSKIRRTESIKSERVATCTSNENIQNVNASLCITKERDNNLPLRRRISQRSNNLPPKPVVSSNKVEKYERPSTKEPLSKNLESNEALYREYLAARGHSNSLKENDSSLQRRAVVSRKKANDCLV